MIGVDSEVATRVMVALLRDPQSSASVIEVSNERGAVTLSGTVLSEEARRAVEETVCQQEGVVTVVNDLRVAPLQQNHGWSAGFGLPESKMWQPDPKGGLA